MRRTILTLFALLLLGACLGWSAGIDVVVMVDVSRSMFPVFDDLVNYLILDLLKNQLHPGDTFHLLSFADSPELEVQTRIRKGSDLTAVIDRILLLEPLGHYTDLIAAVEYLYQYTDSLPGENGKLVLLLTDGIHDPPPGSPNRLDAADVLARLLQDTEKIRRQGWEIHVLRLPRGQGAEQEAAGAGAEGASAGETATAGGTGQDLFDQLTGGLQAAGVVEYGETPKEELTGELTGFSTLTFPAFLGRVHRRFKAPFTITNHSAAPLRYTLIGVQHGEVSLLRRRLSLTVPAGAGRTIRVPLKLPANLASGKQRLAVRLAFAKEQPRIAPLQGELAFEYAPGFIIHPLRSWLIYLLAAVVLAAAVLLIVFFVRNRLQEASFAQLFSGISGRGKGGARPLIMRVELQNPNIGARNIHRVPPGSRRSVGGDGSTFVIFYLPVPKRIGEIRNDGKSYVFVPRRLEHFPELKKPFRGCLGQPIRAVSTRGREVVFRFEEYVSPLEKINSLMRSVPKYHIGEVPLKSRRPRSAGSRD